MCSSCLCAVALRLTALKQSRAIMVFGQTMVQSASAIALQKSTGMPFRRVDSRTLRGRRSAVCELHWRTLRGRKMRTYQIPCSVTGRSLMMPLKPHIHIKAPVSAKGHATYEVHPFTDPTPLPQHGHKADNGILPNVKLCILHQPRLAGILAVKESTNGLIGSQMIPMIVSKHKVPKEFLRDTV